MVKNVPRALEFLKLELKDWPTWWGTLPLKRRLLPGGSTALLWGGLAFLGGLRLDHVWIGLVILILGYGGRSANILLRFLMPLILTGIVYDTQRYYSDAIRGTIRVQEPYLFDKRFFGINTPEGLLTPNEWFQKHTHPLLDFITGLAYLTFIAVFVGQSAYFHFWLSKKGTHKTSATELSQKTPQMMWAFFWLNVIGYSTYYWYPAAPPWYVALYGLGPAQLEALPNPAGCLRFDELLGTHFFTGMYGRSADVFGAIPSLHIAYPLQSVYYAWRFGACKSFSMFFFLLMCFSAVYLNHHYILDIIWGSAYAILVCFVCEKIWDRNKGRGHL